MAINITCQSTERQKATAGDHRIKIAISKIWISYQFPNLTFLLFISPANFLLSVIVACLRLGIAEQLQVLAHYHSSAFPSSSDQKTADQDWENAEPLFIIRHFTENQEREEEG